MSYTKNSLAKPRVVVKRSSRSCVYLLGTWLRGIFLSIFIIPFFAAIKKTFMYFGSYVMITDKKLTGKTRNGWFKKVVVDVPLDRIQSVSFSQEGLLGKIFGYGELGFSTAKEQIWFVGIKKPEEFKNIIMSYIESYEVIHIKMQAEEIATHLKNA